MTLFTKSEFATISESVRQNKGSFLITFRQRYGPTKLKELWADTMDELGFRTSCVSWWSSSGTIGLLECEVDDGATIYGQWALADENKLVGVFEIDDEDAVNIREGFDAGNVVSSEMRAIRLGETGDRD